MDFESSRENRSFLREMDRFLQDDQDPRVMDVTRESMARVCDMRERQAFATELARKEWLGLTSCADDRHVPAGAIEWAVTSVRSWQR